MKQYHKLDPDFRYASPFLKKVLIQYSDQFSDLSATDMPCGNGRNTFLLASHFQNVTAVDVEAQFLTAINEAIDQYQSKTAIRTVCMDVLNQDIADLISKQFICTIHFFNYAWIEKIVNMMNRNTAFMLETPNCNGENFHNLPTENEAQTLFSGCTLLYFDFRVCKHVANTDGRGSLKALVKK